MKAVILAAGEGTRLHPLTQTRPKSMLPIGDRPLLEHIVDAVTAAGIDELLFVVGYKRERIQNYFGNGERWDASIEYVTQENPRGTGHALLTAEPAISGDCLVINGDRIVEPELLRRLLNRHADTNGACLAITEVTDPTQYGSVEVHDGLINNIREKPAPHEVTSNLINTGVYVFGPDIFAAIRQTEHHAELKLTDTLRNYIDEHPLHAVHYDGLWLELSRPWDLLAVNNGILATQGSTVADSAVIHDDATIGDPVVIGDHSRIQPGARIFHDVVIGDNVTIGANTILTNSVILEDTVIKPGTVLTDCIIGSGTELGPLNSIEGGSSDVRVDDQIYPNVKFGGLIGDNVRTGGHVTVEPGSIISNGVTVESGATLTDRISEDVHVVRG
ncbi:glucose-1-phosphate thymidylyltransferase [Haloferax sp. Atlit-6N]|uniref:bifunctional sugar-1-phosphate nucleotidylyltransferase/acetyltransferase n=1 Tax=Haloferax sp. Atlit-6N TaxID=2077205 RepID=UPI000E27E5D0|nr:bifunctional sugar-1-phosphate nucleotidylyltransferase/acetyltransferase [Haloferax sp. Atlit-6N]REA02043.1 glucose-1-phosphate thymidylyltransferase [Haloferax sp. Atlit-6N]